MDLIPIVKKEAMVLASLYDLECPINPASMFSNVYYLDPGMAKLLYAKYVLDKHDCWDDAFKAILKDMDNYAIEAIKAVDVYNWDVVETMLKNVAGEVKRVHNRFKDAFLQYTRRIFGFKNYFKKFYLIFGFNPLIATSRGNGLTSVKSYPVVACFIHEKHKPNLILDVAYHEILHRLLRFNKIQLKSKVEEAILNSTCPEGFLSELIGLAKRRPSSPAFHIQQWLKEEYEKLRRAVEEYFEEEMWRETTIIKFLETKIGAWIFNAKPL